MSGNQSFWPKLTPPSNKKRRAALPAIPIDPETETET
jgi:hypothetical protein